MPFPLLVPASEQSCQADRVFVHSCSAGSAIDLNYLADFVAVHTRFAVFLAHHWQSLPGSRP